MLPTTDHSKGPCITMFQRRSSRVNPNPAAAGPAPHPAKTMPGPVMDNEVSDETVMVMMVVEGQVTQEGEDGNGRGKQRASFQISPTTTADSATLPLPY